MQTQQQAVDPKIIEKIQKLLALGTSSNENEAALAIERAHEILMRYNLSMLDVTDREKQGDVEEFVVMQGKKLSNWKMSLFTLLAQHNICVIFRHRSTNEGITRLKLVGKPHNTIIVREMFEYLVEAIERFIVEKGYTNRNQKNSYCWGIIATLGKRFEEIRRKQEENEIEVDGKVCTALVVRKMVEKELAEVNEFIKNEGHNLRSGAKFQHTIDEEAYVNGKEDGKNISLNQQITKHHKQQYLQ